MSEWMPITGINDLPTIKKVMLFFESHGVVTAERFTDLRGENVWVYCAGSQRDDFKFSYHPDNWPAYWSYPPQPPEVTERK